MELGTPTKETREAGLKALMRELGPVGFIRFWQLFGGRTGDYSVERHDQVDRLTLDEIVDDILARRETESKRPSESGAGSCE